MKLATSATLSILASGEYRKAELYEFDVLAPAATTLRYSNWDTPLTVAGSLYQPGLTFQRGSCPQAIGLNPSKMDVTVGYDADLAQVNNGTVPMIAGVPFLAALRAGYLDTCQFRFSKCFMPNTAPGDTSAGLVPFFAGRVSTIVAGRVTSKITIESNLAILNVQMPRNLYEVGCSHSLFDSGCTLTKADFEYVGQVATGSVSITQFNYTNLAGVGARTNVTLAGVANYFALGLITFTSGQNTGLTRSVKSQLGGVITVNGSFPNLILADDQFTIYPGCDKQQPTCQSAKFGNNIIHFRGYPYIPVPETLYDGGTFNPVILNVGNSGKPVIGSTGGGGTAPGSYAA